MALKITITAPHPSPVHPSSGPGWLTLLLSLLGTFLVGTATALVIQLYVVPRVETRKRREDRWERNVLELGELLTAALDRAVSEAKVAQGIFRDLRQLESEPGSDQLRITRLREEQERTARQATWAFGDLVSIRLRWLVNRIRNFAPEAAEVIKFDEAVRHYQARTMFVRTPVDLDDRPERAFEEAWEQEHSARRALVTQVEQLADLPHPPRPSRRQQSARPASDRYDLLGGPDPL